VRRSNPQRSAPTWDPPSASLCIAARPSPVCSPPRACRSLGFPICACVFAGRRSQLCLFRPRLSSNGASPTTLYHPPSPFSSAARRGRSGDVAQCRICRRCIHQIPNRMPPDGCPCHCRPRLRAQSPRPPSYAPSSAASLQVLPERILANTVVMSPLASLS
ncbi:hypothetical protein DFH06DRAFT_1254934, partial [Mycena polygramma]